MKLLITGGAGFIGSHLADHLLERGYAVVVVDDLSTGAIPNISHLRGQSQFTYKIDTALDRAIVAELVDECDAVFHLASTEGPLLYHQHPSRGLQTNADATSTALELAARKRTPFLLASSYAVYGSPRASPVTETSPLMIGGVTGARWTEAISRASNEALALAYCEERRLPVTIARLFPTVGPRQIARYGAVMPFYVDRALANEPLPVIEGVEGRISLAWVGDVVEDLRLLMENLIARKAPPGEIFNVGGAETTTLQELATLIRDKVNSKSDIVVAPNLPEGQELWLRGAGLLPALQKLLNAVDAPRRPVMRIEQMVQQVVESVMQQAAAGGVGGSALTSEQSPQGIELEFQLQEWADPVEAASVVAQLCRSLSDLHIARGGRGLELRGEVQRSDIPSSVV